MPEPDDARALLNDLELAAHDASLTALLLEALFWSRATAHEQATHFLPRIAWQTSGALATADEVLEGLGVPWEWDNEVSLDMTWLVELRSGLDAYARVCWALRFGYTFAGIAIARNMLERWTYNLGSSTEVWPEDREPYDDYLRRVWAHYESMLEGRDVGQEWSTLSELLHGRAVRIDSNDSHLSLEMTPEARLAVHELTLRIAELALRQVRGAIDTAFQAAGDPRTKEAHLLQAPVGVFPESDEPDFLFVTSPPLDWHFVHSSLATKISGWGATYRRIVAMREKQSLAILGFPWMAVEERWCRTIDTARRAFSKEEEMLGPEFDPNVLTAKLVKYRAIAEAADLVGNLLDSSDRGAALQAAATALESAWCLWLQDVDESLICARGVIESTARARTHRLKPDKAAALEARGAGMSPQRWLDAAGMGRLGAFNRALGEFSHTQATSRHEAARALLTDIQRGAREGAEIFTARAHALDDVATALGLEVAACLEDDHPDLAADLRELVVGHREAADSDRLLEQWLQHSLQFRSFDFGPAVLSEENARRLAEWQEKEETL